MLVTDTTLLEKVIEAATAALEGEGEDNLVVNIDVFEEALIGRGVKVRTLNRGGLLTELQAVREEISVWKARAHNAVDAEAEGFAETRLGALQERERELGDRLWPDQEAA